MKKVLSILFTVLFLTALFPMPMQAQGTVPPLKVYAWNPANGKRVLVRVEKKTLPETGFKYEFSLSAAQYKRLKTDSVKNLKALVIYHDQGRPQRKVYEIKTAAVVQTPAEPVVPPSIPDTAPIVVEPGSVTEGEKIPAARYEFKALYEAWEVRKLTIVNDTQNDGFDYDASEANPVLKRAIIRYKNKDGLTLEKSTMFGADRAIVSDLAIFVPRNSSATVEILVELVKPSEFGPHYSGRILRVGIQDVGNNGTTFDAIGLVSSDRDTSFGPGQISGASSVPMQIVRKAVPEFSAEQKDRNLLPGENKAYELTVKAKGASVELSRLVFDVHTSGLTSVDQLKFRRNSEVLTLGDAINSGEAYLMWDAGAASCFANTAQAGAGTGMDCAGASASSAKLIVAFSEPQIISKDETVNYSLWINVQGVTTGSQLVVRLNYNDESAAPVLTTTVPTTGYLYTGGTDDLFADADDFFTEATTITNRNIIWSDRSAESHITPSVTAGAAPTLGINSSDDFTNGYLLKVTNLPNFVLTR